VVGGYGGDSDVAGGAGTEGNGDAQASGGGGGGDGFDPAAENDDYGTGGGGGGGSDFTDPSATAVAVTDGAWSGNGQVTISYVVPPLSLTTTTLPAVTEGSAYSQQLTATGGVTPYTWVTGGPLPPGVTLSSAGLLSGTPTASGTYTFTAEVTDAEGAAVLKNLTLTVNAALPTAGLGGVKASAGGSTKSVTVLGVTLSTTTWTVASLAPGQAVTFTITGTVPAKGIKVATAAGLALSATSDPVLLNNAGLVSTRITS
jgi:Putative Ig domain